MNEMMEEVDNALPDSAPPGTETKVCNGARVNSEKKKYPYGPVLFILGATVGQG